MNETHHKVLKTEYIVMIARRADRRIYSDPDGMTCYHGPRTRWTAWDTLSQKVSDGPTR